MDSDMLILQPNQLGTEQQRKLQRRKRMPAVPQKPTESVASQPQGGLAAIPTKKPSVLSRMQMPR